MLVSGSDDFTMFLWKPGESKKPVARMTGMRALYLHSLVCLLLMTGVCRAPTAY